MAPPGAYEHCRRLVAETDKDRFWSSLYAPADKRPALHALYAFNLEIARVREAAREPMAGEIRLQWWREVLEGARTGEAAAHPVALALMASLRDYGLPAAPLVALIDAREFDLYDEPMASMAALDAYGASTGGVMFALAAQILGGSSAEIDEIARHAGLAHAYSGMLQALPHHAARGQLYLPLEMLDRYGALPEDVRAQNATFELRAALAEMRLRARRHLAAAGALLSRVPHEVLPALLPAATVGPALARMERRGYRPFARNDLPAWRRQWLIWRAARDPRRIFL